MIEFDDSNRPGAQRGPGRTDRPQRRAAQLARDAALRRVALTRTGVIVSSAGLTAGFVVLVADTAPGKTYKTSSRSGAVKKSAAPAAARHRGTRSLAASLPPLATPSQLGLAAAPTGAASTSATSTGASATSTGSSTTSTGASATSPTQAATSATSAAAATQPSGTTTGSAPVAPVQQAPVVSGGS
jgi:hypothetical protein